MMNICCFAAVIGGAHMALTESQPVLGLYDGPGYTFVQKAVGATLVVCGAGCLMRGE